MAASDSEQTQWADATQFISAVCQELDTGELVHGENFSLFESMAALEIMDPKMDGGMDIGGPKSVEHAIALGMAPVDLEVEQMIDIMDHLLSCEATWHKGHSLAQTVFSTIYMLRLELTTSMPLLHAFCKLTRATCSLARTAVLLAHTHEEEDLFGMAFGLPVDQNDGDGLAILDAAEAFCSRQLRAAGKKATNDNQPLGIDVRYFQCVLSRLRFRKGFYQALVFMDKPQGRGLETARKHISTALSELSAIRESTSFLSTSAKVDESVSATTASGRAAVGFDENLNRSLLPPTPPRSMKLLQWSEALDFFERLLRDLDRVCTVPLNFELEPLLQLIVDFQKSHPDLLARARMQLLVLQDNKLFGTWPMTDVIYKSIYFQNESVGRDDALEKFLRQASWLLGSLLKILCAHPAWQCRKLGKTLEDWSNLFQQVETLVDPSEDVIKKNMKEVPAVTWIACQASWITWQYLWMGFDLELYSTEEYCMIYWYLGHALRTYLHYSLERQRAREELSIQESKRRSDQAESLAKVKSTKKKSKMKKSGKDSGQAGGDRVNPKLVFIQCLSDLCEAYIWMLVALEKDGKLNLRQMEFTTEQERYLQRFELLLRLLVPCPLSYKSFKEATRSACNRFFAVEKALKAVAQARGKTLEPNYSVEIRQLQLVIARNLQILDRAGPGDTFKASLQFSQHPCFGVLVLKDSHREKSGVLAV